MAVEMKTTNNEELLQKKRDYLATLRASTHQPSATNYRFLTFLEGMMIHRQDVETTFLAWKPNATSQEVDDLYRKMQDEWQATVNDLLERTHTTFHNRFGRYPTEEHWTRLQAEARQIATDQVMDSYLTPMTQEIVQMEMEDEEDNPRLQALRDPNGWRTNPHDLQPPSPEIRDLVYELWDRETPLFHLLADALLQRRLFVGMDIPDSPDHPDYPQVVTQVQDAVQTWSHALGEHA